MKYLSTRGAGNDLTFKNILFAGLASDGGLYVPEKWPVIDFNKLKSLNSYSDLALEIIYPFINNDIGKEELKKLIIISLIVTSCYVKGSNKKKL